MKRFSLIVTIILLSIIFCFISCSKKSDQENLPTEMRKAYTTTAKLYNYVWSPKNFQDARFEKQILTHLDKLIDTFHRVEVVTPIEAFEPGFRITLEVNREMLVDARNRFAAGDKEYANWKLRGLVGNCTSCHSRYEVPNDFVGAAPMPSGGSFDEQLAYGEFLLASRQFDLASEAFLTLAHKMAITDTASYHLTQSLLRWAVIEARVKNRPQEAARNLDELLKNGHISEQAKRMITAWISQFEKLAQSPLAPTLQNSTMLLKPVLHLESIENDELNLVNTLKGTSLLHELLLKSSSVEDARKSTLLLGLAYNHIPISSFDVFRDLYLEQCIRQFPNTPEAQLAFKKYEELIEHESSGSSGTHIDPFQQKKLKELRFLAFGSEEDIHPGV